MTHVPPPRRPPLHWPAAVASTPMARSRVAPYTSWGGSRSQVDRAGQNVREWFRAPIALAPAINEAFDVVWKFRGEFQRPLTGVVMGLRSFVKSEGAPVVVAQRLKRLPTIVDKLDRHPHMELSRMQDIGGCRAILPAGDVQLFSRLRARMTKQKWDVMEEYDYVTAPKPSGYRGLHVVVMRDSRLVEIQLRTEGQHRWAETVERLGSITGYNLKDDQGPEELLHYLERGAYGTDLQERGLPLPHGFRDEFNELATLAQPYLVRR